MTMPVSSTSVTAAKPQPVVVAVDNPTALNPCDRCVGAALWTIVLPNGGELQFCASHAVKFGFVSRSISHAVYESEDRQRGSDH